MLLYQFSKKSESSLEVVGIFNFSPIYIAQHYFEITMKTRANLSHISIHCGGGLGNLKRILRSKYTNYESLAKKIDIITKKYFV